MPDYFTYYVYILASRPSGTLYVGITNDIVRRTWEHQNFTHPKCFTARYKITQLMHIEVYDNVMTAILREKKLKKWHREWKFNLITKTNPNWQDLSKEWRHVA
jgi:putative endonuclease